MPRTVKRMQSNQPRLQGRESGPGGAALPAGWEAFRPKATFRPPPLSPEDLPARSSIRLPEGKTVIVVNDAQRATPTSWLLGRFDVDWSREDLLVAVAAGSHPPPSERELHEIFGEYLERVRPHLVLHRAGEEGLIDVGRTSRGTPVEVNPCLRGASSVIALNSVEPHYFAGWTGGRKSLVPGLCSMETMRTNHRLALEDVGPGRTEDNPLHLDLEEGVSLVARWLGRKGPCSLSALNVVARSGHFYGCFRGPLPEAVEGLAGCARGLYGRSLERTFPVVLCLVDPPLDRDLYQALKAFENWRPAVAPGGALIVAAECREGIGPPSFRQFLEAPPPLGDLLEEVARDYRLGDHKLVNYLRYLSGGRRVILVSGTLSPGGDLPMTVFDDLGAALEAAGEGLRKEERQLLIVEDAAHAYPLPAPSPQGG